MNVAVTGCNGFIGSILTEMLLERGYNVYGCDCSGVEPNPKLKNFWNGDFAQPIFIDWIVKAKVKTIFHLAATSLVGPSYTQPLEYYRNNTSSTSIFVDELNKQNWKGHIIFSSTAAVYGNRTSGVLFTEFDQTHPINHYGNSKLMAENILASAFVNGIICTSFRFFNVVGSYKSLGEEVDDTHLLSRLSFAALNQTPFHLYGNDYNTGDGTCVRDYVHVVDVCEAQIHALNTLGTTSTVFNLGTRQGTSVLEMVNAFQKFTNTNVNVVIDKRREGDPDVLVADPRKFIYTTGFEYKHSSLREMITSTWEYYKKRG